MLDSLVRVSRRVGWDTDRFATDPSTDGRGETPARSRSGRRALRAVLASRNIRPERKRPRPGGFGFLGPPAGQHLGGL